MRILTAFFLALALTSCFASSGPEVSEMPSAEVTAPQSEAGPKLMEEESDEEQQTTEPEKQSGNKPSPEADEDSGESVASPITPTRTVEPSPTPTPTRTVEPSPTPTPTRTVEPSPTPTPTRTVEPSPTPTPTRTVEPSPNPTPTKTQSGYTMAQVAQRNTQASCWVVIERKVYDLTDWIRQHPGGRGIILGLCGTDGTNSFNGKHGSQARPAAILEAYLLGPLSQ
jgi:outer membrane biosynthesis protein TonB